jgi:hypothetical protein
MTVSLKIHVNGNYRATVNHSAGGRTQAVVVVGPQEEKAVYFQHGVVNELTVTEEYLGEQVKPAEPTNDDPNSELG